jgi:nucleotide-binding universal stress UspA family protein
LRAGDAAARIAEVARELSFDLIVMPTHASVFRRTLLGSTTAKVLDEAVCPVLTTRHAETLSPRPIEHREWVCLVGLQADSERVLRYVSREAEVVGANLTLLHALPAFEPKPEIRLDLDERVHAEEWQAARRRMDELQRVVGSHARVSIVSGPIKGALMEAARRLHADVLLIGRTPSTGEMGRLRDLTYSVVRDAPCPVLSV